MNRILSKKLKLINLLMVFLVVQLHSYNIDTDIIYPNSIIYFIEKFISYSICRVAVPMCGIISGFLFFFSEYDYKKKVISRVKSLLIPCIIYKVIIGIIVVIATLNIDVQNITSYINKYTYHLWFAIDLFCIALISPIINYLVNKFCKIIFILTMILILFNDSIYFTSLLSYFVLGAIISKQYKNNKKLQLYLDSKEKSIKITIIKLTIWLLISFIYIKYEIYIFRNLSIISGLLFILEVSKFIYNKDFILNLSKYSFFIYLIHEPLLAIVKKVLKLLLYNKVGVIIIYFVAPIITIILIISLANILIYSVPKLYYLMTGLRGKEKYKYEQ